MLAACITKECNVNEQNTQRQADLKKNFMVFFIDGVELSQG